MAMPVNRVLGCLAVNVGLMLCATICSAAVQSEVTVGALEEWIDNVYYSSVDRRHDLSTVLYADFDLDGTSDVTEFDLGYRFSHQNYLRDSYDNQNYMQGSGHLRVHVLPERLFWDSTVNSSVTLRDSITPDNPDNRDQRNFISTGLEFTVLSSRVNTLNSSAAFSATRFRESDSSNSNRKSVGLSWDHVFSSLSSGGLDCSGEEVDFVDTDVYYETVRCVIVVSRRLRNGVIGADLGKRTINPHQGETLDGLSYSLNFNWEEGFNRYSLRSYRDLTDTSVGLSDQDFIGGGGLPTDVNTDVLALTVRKRIEFGYGYSPSGTTDLNLVLYRDSDDLYDSNLDTDREGADITLTRRISRDVTAGVSYSFQRIEYAFSTPFESVDYVDLYEIDLSKNFSQSFQLSGTLSAEVRNGETDNRDYEVYSIRLDASFTY